MKKKYNYIDTCNQCLIFLSDNIWLEVLAKDKHSSSFGQCWRKKGVIIVTRLTTAEEIQFSSCGVNEQSAILNFNQVPT